MPETAALTCDWGPRGAGWPVKLARAPPTTYDLVDVMIASVDVDTDAKGQLTERVELFLAKITVSAAGVSKCWDFQLNLMC